MGYDMHIVDATIFAERIDLPRAEGYFRLNIWGMSIARQIMESIGLLSHKPSSEPWPYRDNFADSGDVDEYGDPRKEVAYHEAMFKALTEPSAGVGKVPAFKFSSNDGWIVTPSECLVIASGLEDRIANWVELTTDRGNGIQEWTEPPEWLADFAAYCRKASAYGGFAVY